MLSKLKIQVLLALYIVLWQLWLPL